MKIIPAIDIINGKCVRLTQGDYAQQKIYNENPLEVAKEFEAAGLKYLHVVDLDGAKTGKVTNWSVIEVLTNKTNLIIDFGGGVKTLDELNRLYQLGVQQVNVGSIAVKQPEQVKEWLTHFGSEKIILSADVNEEQIAIHGWQEKSELSIYDLINSFGQQLQFVTCTDIATDGMLNGPNLTLYKKLLTEFPLHKITASGGVSSLEDVDALKRIGVDGVIIGKAIYENKISLDQLSTYVN
jgi:phosphoribosylformimino-5-aminoimidazole carboxamide ribotide isomerase